MNLKVIPFGVCSDTVKVLQTLLRLAMQGCLRGIAITYRTADGHEETLLTGVFEKAPQNAVTASATLFWHASKRLDQVAGRRV